MVTGEQLEELVDKAAEYLEQNKAEKEAHTVKEAARQRIMELMGEIGEPEADAGKYHIKMDARTRRTIPFDLAKQTLDEETLRNIVQLGTYMVLTVTEN